MRRTGMPCPCAAETVTRGVYYDRGMATMEERVSRLEGAYEQLDQRLGDLTGAVRGLDAKVDALRTDIDGRIDTLRHEMNSKFNTLIVVMATVGVAMIGAMFTLALRA